MEKKEAIREFSLNIALALVQEAGKGTISKPDAKTLVETASTIEKYITK